MNNNNNSYNRLQIDQLISSFNMEQQDQEFSQSQRNQQNRSSQIHLLHDINSLPQSQLNSQVNSNLNNQLYFIRREDLERNNSRNSYNNRFSTFQYLNNSNRGANHQVIETQITNSSPMRNQSQNLQNIQNNNINQNYDSENEISGIFEQQEDNKDNIFGIDNLAVSTENIDFVKCTICMHIYQNPIACGNCLNHFCTICIREWLIRNPNSCPLCKNFREMRCVPMLKNMLDKLSFFCSNKKNGCEEIIGYEQVIKHEDQCDYKMEVCPILGCGTQMIKKLLEKHVQEECDYVLEKCRWCLKQIKKKMIEEHEDICELKEVSCDLCSEVFILKEKLNHNQKCPEQIRFCNWCSKEVKQKDLKDHEDCCGERIVRCQGCNYECCLNDHFLHKQSCLEYPVFCHRCQTEMKRKEFQTHSLEQCIENIQRLSSQKIFQLENENRELKREINIMKNENFNEIQRIKKLITIQNHNSPFTFSQIYKDQDIFVNQQGNTALVREYKKKRRDRFVISDQAKRLLDSNQTITFKIISRRSEWFAIGICDETNVFSNRRYHEIGHLSYLISANGILYSTHSPSENWQNRPFHIEQDNIISVSFIYKQSAQQSSVNYLNSINNQNQQSGNSSLIQNLLNGDQQYNLNSLGNNNQNYNAQDIQRNSSNSQSNQITGSNGNQNFNPLNNNEENSSNQDINNNNNQSNVFNLQGVEMKLKFVNHSENQELIVNLDPKQILDGRFYYCACLRCSGDSVQILPNF